MMIKDDIEIEVAGKHNPNWGRNIEALDSKVPDYLPCEIADAGDGNKSDDGGQCLKELNKETNEKAHLNNEMEGSTDPHTETKEPMTFEGSKDEQMNTTINIEEQIMNEQTDARNEVVEQNASNGGVKTDKDAENARNEVVEQNASSENGVEAGSLVKNVVDENIVENGVEGDNLVKNAIEEKIVEHSTEGEVRYLPVKTGEHSGETVTTIFTQAALPLMAEGDNGKPDDLAAFMKEIESFYRERAMDFKPPKFDGQPLNCLKLWRAVIRLGGYDRVTGSKLWRQVGESFHPPKTCTTVSWTFRIFYEKSLLEYERYKTQSGELQLPVAAFHEASAADTEYYGNKRKDKGFCTHLKVHGFPPGWKPKPKPQNSQYSSQRSYANSSLDVSGTTGKDTEPEGVNMTLAKQDQSSGEPSHVACVSEGGAAAKLKPLASPTSSFADQKPYNIEMDKWVTAERAAHDIIQKVQPNHVSEDKRKQVIDFIHGLIMSCLGVQVFAHGSVALKTYLPYGDIDLTTFGCANIENNLADDVKLILEEEEKNASSVFLVKDVQLICAEVKLVKCIVDDIVVDISFNQIGGLCTLCFLEQVDRLISKDHLFKRSIILIKAWCYYESRILGARHALISTYALETMVLYIFHFFNSTLDGPLAVLFKFLDYFGNFDWETYCVSLSGPVRISSLPSFIADMPEGSDKDSLLSNEFLNLSIGMFTVPSSVADISCGFQQKHLNIFDPLKEINNLGRSVSRGNFYRIRSAFAYGAKKLTHILSQPSDSIANELPKFFSNTMERHGGGLRPDVLQDIQLHASNSDNAAHAGGAPHLAPHSYFSNTNTENSNRSGLEEGPSESSSSSGLIGDYEEYMRCLQYGRYCMHLMQLPPLSAVPYPNRGLWDGMFPVSHYKPNGFPYLHHSGSHPAPTLYGMQPVLSPVVSFGWDDVLKPRGMIVYVPNRVIDGVPKPKGTGVYFPNRVRHDVPKPSGTGVYFPNDVPKPSGTGVYFPNRVRDDVPSGTGVYFPNINQPPQGYRPSPPTKSKNPAPSRPIQNDGLNSMVPEPNVPERNSCEQCSPRKDMHSGANRPFGKYEEVSVFNYVASPTLVPERSRQQKSISLSDKTLWGVQTSESSLHTEPDRSSYHLKDDDFPPLPV